MIDLDFDFDASEIETRKDGETEHELKRRMCATLLLLTLKDMVLCKKETFRSMNVEAIELTKNAINFIDCDNCKKCCEVVNIDYRLYRNACLSLFNYKLEGRTCAGTIMNHIYKYC